ncbi:MAG: L,D-transpeptidase family protein [Candidatus Omnitrophota bacterium]|nr:MAG: L,D-transpeptidase family protein [Candidatus Omnitrophota bacterium]
MKKVFIGVCAGIAVLIIVGLSLTMVTRSRRKAETASVSQRQIVEAAEEAFLKGDFLEAKKLYKDAMNQISNLAKLDIVKRRLEDINMKIIFSALVDEGSVKYVVQPNDALVKIARKFNTTVDLIKRANNLESDVIIPGQVLKVNADKFAIAIDKSQNMLFLKRRGEIIKKYPVATGKDNSSPVGSFKIINRLVNPTWFKTGAIISPDSPENILGSRWMGFDMKGYGIHGTTEPDAIGEQVTLGCIRMKNTDIEELFAIIPTGTEVDIVD